MTPRQMLKKLPTLFVQKLIRVYTILISPMLGPRCRFQPTCSCYAHTAFEKHGFFRGLALTLLRILNCHPLSRRNWYDPVPVQFAWRDILGYKRNIRKMDTIKGTTHNE